MRLKVVTAAVILVLANAAMGGELSIGAAVEGIRSGDSEVVQRSIGVLREAGPAGLEALLADYDRLPNRKMIAAIDGVAGQRGAVVSRLYWYTDLNHAEAAAKELNRPILYLRLMGKLTDEYSCANSRFFRTVLYSNATVSEMLRKEFVLVWMSERPVPIITIDYGDGRTLKRTITGNSIHYVLDSSGRVVDALPGLFDPVSFERLVGQARESAREDVLFREKYFDRADDSILREWKADVAKVKPGLAVEARTAGAQFEKADAAAAMRVATSKRIIEEPLVRAISPQFAAEIDRSIEASDGEMWRKIAALHLADAKLDERSVAVIREENASVYGDPAALERTVGQFEESIAEDSVRNNYMLRREVLGWLRNSEGVAGPREVIALEDLNRRVYSELFLTPRSDPWIGLMPVGMYTGLMCDGCGGIGN